MRKLNTRRGHDGLRRESELARPQHKISQSVCHPVKLKARHEARTAKASAGRLENADHHRSLASDNLPARNGASGDAARVRTTFKRLSLRPTSRFLKSTSL
jgi:hypothetical protein